MDRSEERLKTLEGQVKDLKDVVRTLQSRFLIGNSSSNADQVSSFGPVSGMFGGRLLVVTHEDDSIMLSMQALGNPNGAAPGGGIVDSLNVTINGVARKIALY